MTDAMNLQIASDIHLERLSAESRDEMMLPPAPSADLLILAGDISRAIDGVRRFASWSKPVILVHGNHEARSGHLIDLSRSMRKQALGTNVHYLEQDALEYNGVRFLGCCLWTDFALYGSPRTAMLEAARLMPEYSIYKSGNSRAFSPEYSLAIHRKSRVWLQSELAKPYAGRTVVVTHHAPHPRSIVPRYANDPLNPSFASDLTELMEHVDLWVHGHLHTSSDYAVGHCRVICNPRGYPVSRRDGIPEFENKMFDPQLVVTL